MNELQEKFLQLKPREQIMVGLCGLAAVIFIAYLFILAPLKKQAKAQERTNNVVLAQKQEVRDLASRILAKNKTGATNTNTGTLTGILNQTLPKYNLSMEDFKPSGQTDVRLRLTKANLNNVFAWLNEIENGMGIQVKDISVASTDEVGMALVNLSLHKD